jgi:hypothetical protein
MSVVDPTEALSAFGFSPHEAAWLYRVMTHTGVFLRRQFRQFLGVARGAREQRLDRRLKAAGHAVAWRYHGRELMCHVRSRRLYAAIGQEHSRLRRTPPSLLAAERLMVLDLIAAEPRRYLATEEEKVAWFTSRLGVTRDRLPHRVYHATTAKGGTTTRYFVDRHPIAIEKDGGMSFVVPDVTPRSAAVIDAFLHDYGPLLASLANVEIVYVTGPNTRSDKAQRHVHRQCESRQTAAGPAQAEALDRFFATRRALEQAAYGQLNTDALARYQDDTKQFTGPTYERWYAEWLQGGVVALTRSLLTVPEPGRLTFRHVALPWRYYCLGIDTRIAKRPTRTLAREDA